MQETSARSKYEENNSSAAGQASTNTVDRCRFPVEKGEQSTVCCLLACLLAQPHQSFLASKKRRKLCTARPQQARLSTTQPSSAKSKLCHTKHHQWKKKKIAINQALQSKSRPAATRCQPNSPTAPIEVIFPLLTWVFTTKNLGKEKDLAHLQCMGPKNHTLYVSNGSQKNLDKFSTFFSNHNLTPSLTLQDHQIGSHPNPR